MMSVCVCVCVCRSLLFDGLPVLLSSSLLVCGALSLFLSLSPSFPLSVCLFLCSPHHLKHRGHIVNDREDRLSLKSVTKPAQLFCCRQDEMCAVKQLSVFDEMKPREKYKSNIYSGD